jgi:hypothetical protein
MNFKFSIIVLISTNQTRTFTWPVSPKSFDRISLVYHLPDGEHYLNILNSSLYLNLDVTNQSIQISQEQEQEEKIAILRQLNKKGEELIQCSSYWKIWNSIILLLNIKPSSNTSPSKYLARKYICNNRFESRQIMEDGKQ